MKNRIILLVALALLSLSACENELEQKCSELAVVKDLTGLDGCGFVFQLTDGSYLEPQPVFWCGTPPLIDAPKNVLEDFEFVEGKTVSIGYEVIPDAVSICMVGKIVRITCIEEVMVHQPHE